MIDDLIAQLMDGQRHRLVTVGLKLWPKLSQSSCERLLNTLIVDAQEAGHPVCKDDTGNVWLGTPKDVEEYLDRLKASLSWQSRCTQAVQSVHDTYRVQVLQEEMPW